MWFDRIFYSLLWRDGDNAKGPERFCITGPQEDDVKEMLSYFKR